MSVAVRVVTRALARWGAPSAAIIFILTCPSAPVLAYTTSDFSYAFNMPPLLVGPQYPTRFRCTVVNTRPNSCPVAKVALGLVVDRRSSFPTDTEFVCNNGNVNGADCPQDEGLLGNALDGCGVPPANKSIHTCECLNLNPWQSCSVTVTFHTVPTVSTPLLCVVRVGESAGDTTTTRKEVRGSLTAIDALTNDIKFTTTVWREE